MKNLKTFNQLNEDAEVSYTMTKTYQVSDPESAEAGDYKDQGTEYEDQEFDSLWELAKEIRDAGATEPSESGTNVKATKNTWYSTPDGDKNFSTGEETFYSFHPKLKTDAEAQELAALIKMDRKAFNDAEPGMNENAHEANESPIYEELEEAFMRMLMKGTGINPKDVKSVDSYNKYMIVNMRHGDKFRIDIEIKHVA